MHRQSWRIQVLGGVSARDGDRVITRFRTERTRALLAYLAYYRERAHPREVLIALLWPDSSSVSGRNRLSIELSSLRHQLEPPDVPRGSVILADNASVQFNPQAVTTDAADFEAALQRAVETRDEAARAVRLAEAVSLYSGPMMPDCYLPGCYEEWIQPEQARLSDSYLWALRQLVRYEVRDGELARALDYGRRAVGMDPLREDLHRDLIQIYEALKQPLAALMQYRELRRLLKETGALPSRATRELVERIVQDAKRGTASSRSSRDIVAVSASALPSPSGTITFLLMDSGASASGLAIRQEQADRIVRRNQGYATQQDSLLLAAFVSAGAALDCAIAMTLAFPAPIRMALHTGEAKPHEGRYEGRTVAHARGLLAAAHEGQVLCSESTAAVLPHEVGPGVRRVDLGRYRLQGEDLPERLYQIEDARLSQRQFPPPLAAPADTSNLPLSLTRFFGRTQERERLQRMLIADQRRLLTITGPGGIGKTRLALETAHGLIDALHGAVWFVPLVDLTHRHEILEAIHATIRPRLIASGETLDAVAAALGERPGLLVLDNFEHLTEAGAPIVKALLARTPSLRCLVTSRQRLRLTGEREVSITPLPIPQASDSLEQLARNPSIQMFLDRAQAVRPDFEVTAANAPTLAAVCSRLDGMPLAIELAASRVQSLSAEQLLSRLDHRLDFLKDPRRDVEDRHLSLRNSVDWSYRLLAPELQRLFVQLSVFRGGCTSDEAEIVCAEPLALDFLAQLRECSQVTVTETEAGMRFGMLDIVREFAEEQLEAEERAALAARHTRCYLEWAEAAEPLLLGPDAPLCLERMEQERDNLRSALARAIDPESGDPEIGLRLAGALWRFWFLRGPHQEGYDWLRRALQRAPDASAPLRARALTGAGNIAYSRVDYPTARTLLEESLTLCREMGDERRIAGALGNLANVANSEGDLRRARQLYGEALVTFRKLSIPRSIALTLANLALVACNEQDYARARELHHESLTAFREIGDRHNIALALNNLAYLLLMDDVEAVAPILKEGLALSRELESDLSLAHSITLCCALAAQRNDARRVALLLGAGSKLREQAGLPLAPQAAEKAEQHAGMSRAVLGEDAFAAIHEHGRALTRDQVAACALEGDPPSPTDRESGLQDNDPD